MCVAIYCNSRLLNWPPAGKSKPMEPAPFPNKLCADDLDHNIVKHMAQSLDYRMSEVIRLVTANIPSSATATYHMFLRKLKVFQADMRVKGKVCAADARLLGGSSSSQVPINIHLCS